MSEIARGRDRQGVSGDIPEGTECSLIAKEMQSAISKASTQRKRGRGAERGLCSTVHPQAELREGGQQL